MSSSLTKEEVETLRIIIAERKDRKVIMSFLRNKIVIRLFFTLITAIVIIGDHFGPQILKFIVANAAAIVA